MNTHTRNGLVALVVLIVLGAVYYVLRPSLGF
jgi:hypothetical protein